MALITDRDPERNFVWLTLTELFWPPHWNQPDLVKDTLALIASGAAGVGGNNLQFAQVYRLMRELRRDRRFANPLIVGDVGADGRRVVLLGCQRLMAAHAVAWQGTLSCTAQGNRNYLEIIKEHYVPCEGFEATPEEKPI